MSDKLILLADDSSTMHRAVKLALSRSDYEILCVDNGTDALRLCREKKPALLIADLDLPGVSGSELIRLVKSEPPTGAMKVILLCASIHQSDMGRLDRISADARLWKPFESEALFTIVQTLMKASQAASPRMSTTLSSAKTQQMDRSSMPSQFDSDATRPMKASTLVDRTMPPVDPASSTASVPTAKISPREATQNLWTPDFDLPSSKTEKTPSSTESLSMYREAQEEWEVLDTKQKTPPPPTEAKKSGLSVNPPTQENRGAITREDVRNMIRAEIQLAFDTWFREKLEAKLQDILSQIESESKK